MGTKYLYKIHNSLSLPFSGLFGFELFRKGTFCFHKQVGKELENILTKRHMSEESVKCVACLYVNKNIWNDFFKAWDGTIVVI